MKTPFRYDVIYMYGSLQSVGHTMEYFIQHTRKLVIFIVMPRGNNLANILRIYIEGKMTEERNVRSSTHIAMYYLLWLWYHNIFLIKYFSRHERVIVLTGHPIAFMGMSVMRLIRNVRYAYWIGDYFPPVHWSLVLFEKLKKFYHSRVTYTYYLSDRLNALYNGSILTQPNKCTVMWGVQPFMGLHQAPLKTYRLLFVGVIRPSQGIEDLLLFLKRSPSVYLSILGSCELPLYKRYMSRIDEYGITRRVYFPNAFIDDIKLRTLAQTHHVGIALYEKGMHTATYYTDPGKVKTYIELGLPVVMTDTSAISSYVKQFGAGIVVKDESDLPSALDTVKQKYPAFQKGLRAFGESFEYEQYYRHAFKALEQQS